MNMSKDNMTGYVLIVVGCIFCLTGVGLPIGAVAIIIGIIMLNK